VVPALTLGLHVPTPYAIGASIVSVIATSSGAAASYVREHLANLRLAMLLEVATVLGALAGAFLAGVVDPRWLSVVFGVVMACTAVAMFVQKERAAGAVAAAGAGDRLADALALHGSYHDAALGRDVEYTVRRTRLGLAMSAVAGTLSGLLGVGGGVVKVPTMTLGMGVPLKAATATSNLMIGVTAAASAGVYFVRGDIDPFIAGPVAAGVLVGAVGGSRLLGRLRNAWVRGAFVVVLLVVAWQMIAKGVRG
jgi:uncharacterized membrane protein YfcA